MTIEITYATRCECTIYTVDGDSWTYNHQFHSVKDATDWARVQIDDRPIDFDIEHVYVTDCETGELLAVLLAAHSHIVTAVAQGADAGGAHGRIPSEERVQIQAAAFVIGHARKRRQADGVLLHIQGEDAIVGILALPAAVDEHVKTVGIAVVHQVLHAVGGVAGRDEILSVRG